MSAPVDLTGSMQFGRRKYTDSGDVLDIYLKEMNLERKDTPKEDAMTPTFYRAAADQVLLSQWRYDLLQEVSDQIAQNCPGLVDGNDAVERDMKIISALFGKDFVTHTYAQGGKKEAAASGENSEGRPILCRSTSGQYYPAYNRDLRRPLGMAQSIVFGVLYEEVFDMKQEVAEEVTKLRNRPYYYGPVSTKWPNKLLYGHEREVSEVPPFPYRIAKALDPRIYRNTDYDSWIQEKKSAYYEKEKLYHSTKFYPGVMCNLKKSLAISLGTSGQAIFQDMVSASPPRAKVYVIDIGEFHEFSIDQLTVPDEDRSERPERHPKKPIPLNALHIYSPPTTISEDSPPVSSPSTVSTPVRTRSRRRRGRAPKGPEKVPSGRSAVADDDSSTIRSECSSISLAQGKWAEGAHPSKGMERFQQKRSTWLMTKIEQYAKGVIELDIDKEVSSQRAQSVPPISTRPVRAPSNRRRRGRSESQVGRRRMGPRNEGIGASGSSVTVGPASSASLSGPGYSDNAPAIMIPHRPSQDSDFWSAEPHSTSPDSDHSFANFRDYVYEQGFIDHVAGGRSGPLPSQDQGPYAPPCPYQLPYTGIGQRSVDVSGTMSAVDFSYDDWQTQAVPQLYAPHADYTVLPQNPLPSYSIHPTGMDLPQDLDTLQFYYNMGIQFRDMSNNFANVVTVAAPMPYLSASSAHAMTNGNASTQQPLGTPPRQRPSMAITPFGTPQLNFTTPFQTPVQSPCVAALFPANHTGQLTTFNDAPVGDNAF